MLMIGIPIHDTMPADSFASFINFIFETLNEKVPFTFIIQKGTPIEKNRNDIVQAFLKSDCDELLFLDSDQTFPTNLYHRLKAHDSSIVSGFTWKKRYPFEPSIFKRNPDGSYIVWPNVELNKVYEADGVGMFCCLIKKKVFEVVPYPWFKSEPNLGEDFYFCQKAKEKGFKIIVDTGIICGHVGAIVDEKFIAKAREGQQS